MSTMNGTEKALVGAAIGCGVVAVAGVTVGTVALVRANRANRGVADLYGQVGMLQQTMQIACTPTGGSFVPQMNGGSNGIV
jgi:hypothetical protein